MDETVHELKKEINEAVYRLSFLLDYAVMPSIKIKKQFLMFNILIIPVFFYLDEDIKLNSQLFQWPQRILTTFETATNRLMSRRDHVEDEVRRKRRAFEAKLDEYNREVESYKKKEVSPQKKFKNIVIIEYFWCFFLIVIVFFDKPKHLF